MTAPDEERLARVALSRLSEPGDPRMTSLVAELGGVAVRDHLASQRDLMGLRSDVAARLVSNHPEADLERAARRGIRFVVPGDDEWPRQLDDLASVGSFLGRGGPPLGLWVRGPARLDALTRSVAVVGSRCGTTYGGDLAGDMGARLVREEFWVVSGAAFGIDQAAHRGALAGAGPGSVGTVAVLASGADRAYPAAHRAMIDYIAEVGAVISEAAPGSAPTRHRFLARNRVIAALTRGTLVVEAALRSGALHTAGWAERLNRQVMGVPGPVTSPTSEGVHQLLRTGGATLVTNADELLELVGSPGEHLVEVPRGPVRPRDRLTMRQQQVLDAVPVATPAPDDSIARTAGIGVVEVRAALDTLLRLALVEESPGGWRLTALALG